MKLFLQIFGLIRRIENELGPTSRVSISVSEDDRLTISARQGKLTANRYYSKEALDAFKEDPEQYLIEGIKHQMGTKR